MDAMVSNDWIDRVDRNLGGGDFRPTKAQMTTTGKEYKTQTPPDSKFILWCPFCNDFSSRDSMIARKRLGQHLTDRHPEEVRFRKGTRPPTLEEFE